MPAAPASVALFFPFKRLTWPPFESMIVDIFLASVDADMPVTIQANRVNRMFSNTVTRASASLSD
eukprot:5656524-Amphidinium_carterae.1